MITEEYINELALQAQYCDDYSQYKREMAYVAQLRLELDKNRVSDYNKNRPSTRRTYLRTKEDVEKDSKKNIAGAIEKMERFFNRKKGND